jgi:hypothetical protein
LDQLALLARAAVRSSSCLHQQKKTLLVVCGLS